MKNWIIKVDFYTKRYILWLVLFGGSRTAKLFAIWRQRTGKLFAISRTGRNQLRLEQICVLGLERVVKKILEWQFQSDFINVLRPLQYKN